MIAPCMGGSIKSYLHFEEKISAWEYELSKGNVIPGLGALAGAAKVTMGSTQTITSAVALIGSAPWLWTKRGRSFSARAISHVANGIANIAAGTFESIPGVGAAIFMYRNSKNNYREECKGFIVGYHKLYFYYKRGNKSLPIFRRSSPYLII